MTNEQKYYIVYETRYKGEYYTDRAQFDTREELDDFVKDMEPCEIWAVIYGSDITREFDRPYDGVTARSIDESGVVPQSTTTYPHHVFSSKKGELP
jgi:hypothetical protein